MMYTKEDNHHGWVEKNKTPKDPFWSERNSTTHPYYSNNNKTMTIDQFHKIFGLKDDTLKPQIFKGVIKQFPNALEAVAKVSAYGARKYSWNNWANVDGGIERYTDALARHLVNEAKGEVFDVESGYLSAASTAWNALVRLELIIREQKNNEEHLG